MRIATFLTVMLVALPARAGTVTSLSFVDGSTLENVVANGVAASKSSGFVLYQHGHWQAPAPSAVAASPAGATLPAPTLTSAGPPPAPLVTDGCSARPIPWRSGLSTRTILGRAAYWPVVRDAECRHGLPVGLLDALVLQESRYQPAAVSRAGAGGLAQLMPGTAADLGVSNRFDPVANINAGARYLRSMLDHYRSLPIALAAYNAGMGSVKRAGGIPLNGETPNYVRSVLGFWNQSVGSPGIGLTLARAELLSFSGGPVSGTNRE